MATQRAPRPMPALECYLCGQALKGFADARRVTFSKPVEADRVACLDTAACSKRLDERSRTQGSYAT